VNFAWCARISYTHAAGRISTHAMADAKNEIDERFRVMVIVDARGDLEI
jgi:hypothetical protein